MKDRSNLSLESKCDDDETWHDTLANFKVRRPPIFATKLESSFSFHTKHHDKRRSRDSTNDERSHSNIPKLKPVSFRRPWKPAFNNTTSPLLNSEIDDVPQRVQNGCFLDHRNPSGSTRPPKSHEGGMPSRRLPDMALLKRLNTERQRATKESLEAAQRVIRHVPRKLRRTIHQPSHAPGITEEEESSDMGEEKGKTDICFGILYIAPKNQPNIHNKQCSPRS